MNFESVSKVADYEDQANLPALNAFYAIIALLTFASVASGLASYLSGAKLHHYVEPFNLATNWNSLLSMEVNPKAITSIDGLRVISITIIAFGHLLNNMLILPISNKQVFAETAGQWIGTQVRV